MSISPPPIRELISDENRSLKMPWALFFNNIWEGDTGEGWTPTFTSLTTVGSPTITGRYYRVNQNLVYWSVTIVPATSTSSTAGTTYMTGFPLRFSEDATCIAVSGGAGALPGHVISSNQRIHTPAWSAVTVPLTIVGFGVAR